MCGVVGWLFPHRRFDVAVLQEHGRRALDCLRPRGPDGDGVTHRETWLLGHTRLAILDLSERAAQPMTDGSGHWLVFNGEVYNFRELRATLEGLGHQFHSTGDSEVVLKAMNEWGLAAIPRLRGMFAFAWLDENQRELILARDRFGVKPLVYTHHAGSEIRFASDLRSLRCLPGAGSDIDVEALHLYLGLGYVPAPHSILTGVRKLKPGSYLRATWSDSGVQSLTEEPYWRVEDVDAPRSDEQTHLDEEFASLAGEAIDLRLISDVPVGVLLSGGLDSTLVATMAQDRASDGINTFTMGFDDPQYDESPDASAIAEALATNQTVFRASASDVFGMWTRMLAAYDEPFADPSAIAMVSLCHGLREYVKVALTGDGGDETGCGYPWHRALHRAESAPTLTRWIGSLLRLGGGRFSRKWQRIAQTLSAPDRASRWARLRTGLSARTQSLLPVAGADGCESFDDYFRRVLGGIPDHLHPMDWACRADLKTYLPDDLMVKSDRASMAVGLELREPLLDAKLVEWWLKRPVEKRYVAEGRQSKQFTRRLLYRRLDRQLLDRPKRGFIPPLAEWIATTMRPIAESAVAALESGELAPLSLPPGVRSFAELQSAIRDDRGSLLWRIMCYDGWLRGADRAQAAETQNHPRTVIA